MIAPRIERQTRKGASPMAAKDTIDTYIAAWNETDEAKRTALIE